MFQNEKFIICGNFKVALNQNLDTKNYLNINNPKTRDFILENGEKFGFKDPFREFYPKLKRYTWTKKNPVKQAKLDYFLVSEELMAYVEKIWIVFFHIEIHHARMFQYA